MKINKYTTQRSITSHVVGVICNACGTLVVPTESDYHLITFSGGYHSQFPGDGACLQFEVCDRCAKAWVATFKIQPVIDDSGPTTTIAIHTDTYESYLVPDFYGEPSWILTAAEKEARPSLVDWGGLDDLRAAWEKEHGAMDDMLPQEGTLWVHQKTQHIYTVCGYGFTADRRMHIHYRRIHDLNLIPRPVTPEMYAADPLAQNSDWLRPWDQWKEGGRFHLIA